MYLHSHANGYFPAVYLHVNIHKGLSSGIIPLCLLPGAIARSVAMSLGNQEAPRSILMSRTSFREDSVMKLFLRPFFLFR